MELIGSMHEGIAVDPSKLQSTVGTTFGSLVAAGLITDDATSLAHAVRLGDDAVRGLAISSSAWPANIAGLPARLDDSAVRAIVRDDRVPMANVLAIAEQAPAWDLRDREIVRRLSQRLAGNARTELKPATIACLHDTDVTSSPRLRSLDASVRRWTHPRSTR